MIFKRIKKLFLKIEHSVPYIPNFNNVTVIFKIIVLSFFLTITHTFVVAESFNDLYLTLWANLKSIIPYLLLNLFFLIIASNFIKKLTIIKSIFSIVVISIITTYLSISMINQSFYYFFLNWENTFLKIFSLFGIIFFFLLYFDWTEKTIDPAQTTAKLITLQSKMRPHFLFNTLNSIVALIKRDPNMAKKMLLNLSEILRASLKNDSKEISCTIESEVALCEKYLEIEKMRLANRLNVVWDINPDTLSYIIPKLLLQPLIENSILHGIQYLENGGTIEIKISKNLIKDIIIEIKNPIPTHETKHESNNNIGIKNIEERLQIFFDYEAQITHTKTKEFYYVKIELPN